MDESEKVRSKACHAASGVDRLPWVVVGIVGHNTEDYAEQDERDHQQATWLLVPVKEEEKEEEDFVLVKRNHHCHNHLLAWGMDCKDYRKVR